MVGWYGTRDQVLLLSKAFISVSIAWSHLGSLEACVKHVGSIGGGLGEPEDEDEEDSSAGAGGGGGERVCDGGGSGGGESQWWGPHEKRGLEQWKITEAWRWGLVVKAWE